MDVIFGGLALVVALAIYPLFTWLQGRSEGSVKADPESERILDEADRRLDDPRDR